MQKEGTKGGEYTHTHTLLKCIDWIGVEVLASVNPLIQTRDRRPLSLSLLTA